MTPGSAPRGALEVLGALTALARRQARPEEALAAVRALGAEHGLLLDLVWEEDAFSGAYHYDALLREPGLGTYALSLCPEGATPWPLRGVLAVSERDLLRVDAERLTFERALACLDFLWSDADLLRQLVDVCLVEGLVRERAIQPDAAQLQRAMDQFRRAHRLLTAVATEAWMAERGLSQRRLEGLLAGEAATLALRDEIADEARVEALFERERGGFDVAHVARLRVRSEALARSLASSITAGELTFHEALEQQFFAGRAVAVRGGALASVTRRSLPAVQAALVFSAPPGSVLGPLPAPEGHDLVRVVAVRPAELREPATREAVADAVFRAWLDERRAAATIEWFWGTVEQTEAALAPR